MFFQDKVAIGTTPVEVTSLFDSDQEFELRLYTTGSIFLGSDSGVTDADGWPITGASSPLVLRLQGDAVWVVGSSANQQLYVIAHTV